MDRVEMHPFDMTVIVPVYNAEAFLADCVASLDAQTMPQRQFEVVLVNDGSTDNSLAICEKYASRRPNYAVIDQPNQGVSAARNAGMRAARGRYLMFLDSDDRISKKTVSSLVKAFDSFGDRADLVTYDIEYLDQATGRTHGHKRQKWLTKTDVYDLSTYPHVAQSTMNVCVRNLSDPILFREDVRMGEDQVFITTWLTNKAAIGYCAEARYTYVKHAKSASASGDYPQYAFEDMMLLFDMLFDLARTDGHMERYAYSLILYNIGWRYEKQKLFPDFGEPPEREGNYERLAQVARSIPREEWATNPHLTDESRICLCAFFGIVDKEMEVICQGGKELVRFADGFEMPLEKPAAVIDAISEEGQSLLVEGHLSWPALLPLDPPELQVSREGELSAVPLSRVCPEDEDADSLQTQRWHFSLPLAWKGSPAYRVAFTLGLGSDNKPLGLRFDGSCCEEGYVSWAIRMVGKRPLSISHNTLFVGSIRGLPKWMLPVVKLLLALRDWRT